MDFDEYKLETALSGCKKERDFENLIKAMNSVLKSINDSGVSDFKEIDDGPRAIKDFSKFPSSVPNINNFKFKISEKLKPDFDIVNNFYINGDMVYGKDNVNLLEKYVFSGSPKQYISLESAIVVNSTLTKFKNDIKELMDDSNSEEQNIKLKNINLLLNSHSMDLSGEIPSLEEDMKIVERLQKKFNVDDWDDKAKELGVGQYDPGFLNNKDFDAQRGVKYENGNTPKMKI